LEIKFFESVIIKYLFTNQDARDTILPYLSPKIFSDFDLKEICKHILTFNETFKKFPTVSDMKLHIEKKELHDSFLECLNLDLTQFSDVSLLTEMESFIRKKLIWDVIADTAENLKEDKMNEISDCSDKLREAVSFTFNTEIGLDFFENGDRLYDALHEINKAIPTGLFYLDKILKGGLHEKTLTIFLGEVGLGKTATKCAIASNILLQNKNVLYITLEMSEEKISERIMANILDVKLDDLVLLSKDTFYQKFEAIRQSLKNKFIIKEYPTKSINSNNIRILLKELKVKKNFVPNVVFVDYLGIMNSNTTRKSENSYTEVKRISEELRGVAVEFPSAFVSSVQVNRDGVGDVDIDITNMSDSLGPAMTADVIIAITQSDEFIQAGKFSFIILKNRYGVKKKKTVIDVDYNYMRLTQKENKNTENKDEQQKPPITTSTIVDDASVMIINKMNLSKKENQKKVIDFT